MENIHKSWHELFDNFEFDLDIFYSGKTNTFPSKDQIFRVFSKDVAGIRILLLGQDCYHGKGQANGLSFSVNKDVKIPPSLRNIYKELNRTFPERNYEYTHGDLSRWFDSENIFLLNCSLTVEEGNAGSHMSDWEEFTDAVISYIDKHNKNVVYILLGKFAKSKKQFITNKEKCVEAPHPSPLARGFVGSDIFKMAEKVLGMSVNWSI